MANDLYATWEEISPDEWDYAQAAATAAQKPMAQVAAELADMARHLRQVVDQRYSAANYGSWGLNRLASTLEQSLAQVAGDTSYAASVRAQAAAYRAEVLRGVGVDIFLGANLKATSAMVAEAGRQAGSMVAAIQLLNDLSEDNSYKIGETATSAAAGLVVGVLVAPLAVSLAGVGAVVAMGLAAGVVGKWVWAKYMAPSLGYTEQTAPPFWDNLFGSLQNFDSLLQPSYPSQTVLLRAIVAELRDELPEPVFFNLLDASGTYDGAYAEQKNLLLALGKQITGHEFGSVDGESAFLDVGMQVLESAVRVRNAGVRLQLLSGGAAYLADAAKRDFASFYALRESTPFVLTGTGLWNQNHPGLYQEWARENWLDSSSSERRFSDRWLQDRAKLLDAKIRYSIQDSNAGIYETFNDLETNFKISAANFSNSRTYTFGSDGADGLEGSTSDDDIFGGSGNDRIEGGAGADYLEGNDGSDYLDAGENDDWAYGQAGSDILLGGGGQDHLFGGIGEDTLRGGADNDTLFGGDQDDVLMGEEGTDSLYGGRGDDSLTGGSEYMETTDYLIGGLGFDTYRVDGGDVVVDEDGQGELIYGPTGELITGGTQSEDDSDVYESDDGRFVFYEASDGLIVIYAEGANAPIVVDLGLCLDPRDPSDSRGGDGNDEGGGGGAPGSGGANGSGKDNPLGLKLKLKHPELPRRPKSPAALACFKLAEGLPAPRRDPILLDLDGDGVETVGQSSAVYFDHDGNGFAELTGWVGSGDGLLVWDRNGDDLIRDGSELIGDMTLLPSGTRASSGAAALAYFDQSSAGGNDDGRVDGGDAIWSELRVWQDLDSDGFTDAGELRTLEQAGVSGFSLEFSPSSAPDGHDNILVRTGTFERADGISGTMGEYLLARDTSVTLMDKTVELSDELLALPEVRGSGNALDLRQAMAQDASGALESLVESFVAESDGQRRSALLDQILFAWAGSAEVNPASRGGLFDARKLAVLEKFLGESFDGALGANPSADASVLLQRGYRLLAEGVYAQLLVQTHLQDLYYSIDYTLDRDTLSVQPDFSRVTQQLDDALQADPASGRELLSEFARMLRGLETLPADDYASLRAHFASQGEDLGITFDSGGRNVVFDADSTNSIRGSTDADLLAGGDGNDSVTAYDGNDVVYGGAGDDVLSGCENDDQLYGGAGRDVLFGAEDNDVLDGGAGNDLLNGGTGNDVYVLALGTGRDEIIDYDATPGNNDAIRIDFSAGALAVRIWRSADDLYVGLEGTDDVMRVQQWFTGTANRVEQVILADGSLVTVDQLAAAWFIGSAQADVISAADSNDTVQGLDGNDTLFGGRGNDVLDGGAGNDTLYGGSSGYTAAAGAGNDVYLFGRGYGRDSIYDYDTTAGNIDVIRLTDLNAGDVTIRREGRSFIVDVNDSNDEIRVADWGLGTDYRIERVEFADGSVLDGAALVAPFLGTPGADDLAGGAEDDVFAGLEGDDILKGGAGNDVLDGGAGNDTLYGGASGYTPTAGAGDDTYIFGRGYGSDAIYDYDTSAGNRDTVRLKDLNAADVTIRRDGSVFVIDVNDSADELRVASWGLGAEYRFERIEFADGSVLEGSDLVAPFLGTAGDDTLTGSADADLLLGLQGNDLLFGGAGNDVLDGGAGNDTLYGGTSGYTPTAGAGDDTYIFGRGYGSDAIYDYDTSAGNRDTVRLKDLNAADVTIRRDGSVFVIDVNDSADELRVASWGLGAEYRFERIEFADGSVLEGSDLVAPFLGTAGDDTLTGSADADLLLGLQGNDLLFGGAGNDVLDGGAGNDTLYGGTSGYTPTAGAGNDTYIFGRGYGSDAIVDYDVSAGNRDTVRLKDLNAADVTIRRDGSVFVIDVNDSADELRVASWGLGAEYRFERIEFADGSVLEGSDLVAPFLGTAGDDTLTGSADADLLLGLQGNDLLFGGAGNDVLDGGAGNDTLYGGTSGYSSTAGAGNDTYIFGRGYGSDAIVDYDVSAGNRDTVRLKDLNAADVTIRREGNAFVIDVNDSADELRMPDWGLGADHRIERVEFADGSVLEGSDLVAPFLGTAGDDTLTGSADADLLLGLQGNDVLFGGAGNDVLDGGAGNDTLYGGTSGYSSTAGAGNDTYIFGRGYGSDAIIDYDVSAGNRDTVRLKDLNAADVTIRREGNAFVIDVNDSADELRMPNWGLGADHRIERVEFADGSVLEGSNLIAPFLGTAGNDTLTGTTGDDVLSGLAGNDTLLGTGGNDVLDGGAGTDTLFGGNSGYTPTAGNDTYIFGRGYGNDAIYDYDAVAGNVDTIELKDLNAADVTIRRDNTTFYIAVNGAADQIRISDWALGSAYRIERVKFADGTTLEAAALAATPYIGTSGVDSLTGTAEADVLKGLGGNDTLTGGGGDDILDGGTGNDTLRGGVGGYTSKSGAGNDIYLFGRGYGQDSIYDFDDTPGNLDVIRLFDLNPTDVTVRRTASSFFIDVNGTTDQIKVPDWAMGAAYRIERVEFADGSILSAADLARTPYLGTASADTINGTAEDEIMYGLAGNDTLVGGDGNDMLLGGEGIDTLYGSAGSDILDGEAGADRLYGNAGDDVFKVDATGDIVNESANEGNDTVVAAVTYTLADKPYLENINLEGAAALDATGNASNNVLAGNAGANAIAGNAGNDLLRGAAGNDRLDGGVGNDLLIGERDDDSFDARSGTDVVAVNGGDGRDSLLAGGTRVTLSLGRGIALEDLALRKAGSDLVLETSAQDSVTLAGWYNAPAAQPQFLSLQTITEAMAGFDSTSTNPLLNKKVQQFDLKQLAQQYDLARAGDPALDRWSLMNRLLDVRLAAADSEAIGGDLAYQYGMNGSLAGIGLTVAQQALAAPQFGAQPQALHTLSELQTGAVRLT